MLPYYALEVIDDRLIQRIGPKRREGPIRGPVPVERTRIVREPPADPCIRGR
jgi:hypothetical protein